MARRPAVSGARRVLRRMRTVMAGAGIAQERLNKLVKVIAVEMVAEVCSVYVMRAGEVLELFATEGLNKSAVHRTRLMVGEGLVGEIAAHARPLNLSDAQSHPQFAYRPETGEEVYHSLLGAPILRGGRVRGVVVVQNSAQRHYTEEETEALEVIATVLAELIAGGDLVSPEERLSAQGNAVLPVRLEGIRITAGLAMGEAVFHQPRVSIPQMFSDNPDDEAERLTQAVASMQSALDDLFKASHLPAGGEHREVLEAYRMFAEDRGWLKRMREAILSGLTAEAAVQKVEEDTRARMDQTADPYLKERLRDLEDLASRLLQHLSGKVHTAAQQELPDNVVLIARSVGPAELLDYEPGQIRAVVMEEGSPTGHVAVVARALDIPVVGRVDGLMNRIDARDPVIVDGDNALVFIRPGDDIRQNVAENLKMQADRRAATLATRDQPAVTRDGIRISLNLNAGLLMDLRYLEDTGADGIGLYRTEIPFMVRSEIPSVAAQTELYGQVLDQAEGKPIMFRTLDIGGDKQLPYFEAMEDQNPSMGWRAIRVALDRPAMLRQQLRALISAAGGRDLNVMFPMIAEVAEFQAAREVLELELDHRKSRGGVLPGCIRVGTMVEVPGLVWQLSTLLPRVDFLSVGSNDLFQFLFAADRSNPRISGRYDVLAPGLLSLLRGVVMACAQADVPVSLCGDMAGSPLEAMALIGLGFRTISMPPANLGAVKTMTRSLDTKSLSAYLESLYNTPDHSLREKLRAYAMDHGVILS